MYIFDMFDRKRPFILEQYTPLYYDSVYTELSDEQRLTYNQLSGIMANEQFCVFEHDVLAATCERAVQDPSLQTDQSLLADLRIIISDEHRHRQEFFDTMHAAMPEHYKNGYRFFTQVSWWKQKVANLLTSSLVDFRFLVWHALCIEEFSVSIGNALDASNHTTLGTIDPNYRALHCRHRDDELHHLPIGESLIESWVDVRSPRRKKVDYFLLNKWLLSLRTPRLAGIAVVNELIRQFPSLQPLQQRLHTAVCAVRHNRDYQQQFISPSATPRTWAAWNQRNECNNLLQQQAACL